MRSRFTYSRWDGTQTGFDLTAEEILAQATDDLVYHGDVNAALRRMLQEGLKDRMGDHIAGIRELLGKLRQRRGGWRTAPGPGGGTAPTTPWAASTTTSPRSGGRSSARSGPSWTGWRRRPASR